MAAGPLSDFLLIEGKSGALSKIFVVRGDGRDWQRLTNQSGSEADPCPAPGQDLIYYRTQLAGDWDIARWDLKKKRRELVVQHPAVDRQPRPSPDGRWLAYVSQRFGAEELMLLDLQSSDLATRRLTFDQGNNCSPCWLPDSRSLIYSSRCNGQADLYRIQIPSGDIERLTRSDQDEVDPSLSPDGSRVVFQSVEGMYQRGKLGLLCLNDLRAPVEWLELPGTAHRAGWSPDGLALHYLDYHAPTSPTSPTLMSYSLEDRSLRQLPLFRRELGSYWHFQQACWGASSQPIRP